MVFKVECKILGPLAKILTVPKTLPQAKRHKISLLGLVEDKMKMKMKMNNYDVHDS